MNKEILIALGDLTNGALNYYQTPRVVMAKRDIIETYINNLKEIEKEHQKINGELREENKQLKEVIEEIREYVKNNDNFELADLYSQSIADEIQNKLLQILDKATKENE